MIDPPNVIEPPPERLVPEFTVTASSASFAIGISSLSISATIVAAIASFISPSICAELETAVEPFNILATVAVPPKAVEPAPPIVMASSASLAIGISSLSISATIVAAIVSFIKPSI